MAQRGPLQPLRVTVPTAANSPSQRLSKYHIAFSPSPTPAPVIYQRPHNGGLWIAVLLQLSSLYAAHHWLTRSQQGQEPSVIKFAFLAFFGASVVLGFLQRPWKGRSISPSQWSMLFVSGALLALSFLFRMRGLADVGPLETILAEYAGAVVGKVLIKAQRNVHGIGDAKFRGAIAFLVGLFLLSQGWGISPCSPLSSLFLPATKSRKMSSAAKFTRSTRIGYTSESRAYLAGQYVESLSEEDCTKYVRILAPLAAGLLSSMQKLLPSTTNLSSLPKKRLQALTYLTAGAVSIPVALFQLAFPMGRSTGGIDQQVLWPLFSMIAFGMVVAFYGDFYSEEKLLISSLSSFHFFVTVCSVCLLELTYGSNFSLLGFVVCSVILAVGVRAGAFISGGLDWNSISEKEYEGPSLFSMMKTPVYHIWTDVKTRKIAIFLLLNTSFMVVEFLYGFLSNSLGLISDACHMLFDCAALAIGLYASYISRLPPNSKFNFGYGRFEVLSGYANAVFLILVASLIVLESLERLLEPPEISTESLLVVSVGGLLVNVVGLIFFHEAHHHAHGSAPCTHVHRAHSDRVASNPAPKLGTSFPHSHNSSSEPGVAHSNVLTGIIGGGEDSPILNLQQSSSEVCASDGHRHSSQGRDQFSQEHDRSGDFLHHDSHHHTDISSTGHLSPLLSPSRAEHQHSASCSHIHKDEHDQHSPLAEHQHSARCSHNHKDEHDQHSPLAEHQHSASCSHNHKDEHDQHSPLAEHQHSASCSHDHKDEHDQHNPFAKHQHSASCSHNHKDQHDQHNPLAEHAHLHNTQKYSGSHQHHQRDGHPVSRDQLFPGHSHSHSDNHRVGRHATNYDDHGHGIINNTDVFSHSGIEHRHNGISNLSGEDENGSRDSHHHVHHEETRNIADHRAAGQLHHHLGQPCSHDYDNDRKEHHGHDHAHSHTCNGDHHADNEQYLHANEHHHGHDHHHDHDHDEHSDHHHIDHNMEGIFLHILADTLGSVGVVISTLLIKYKGWLFTDPACSIFISVLIVSSVLPLVRNTAELLLQRVPRSAEKRIQKALRKVEVVEGVHDWHKLHVWSNTNTELVGTLRLHASIGTNKLLVHKKVSRIFEEAGILDLTLEVEDLEHDDDQ